ncbi:hypothetical protein [Porphyromonas levii]|nr:hypothetical protein [Porphyromonas levii]
MQRHPFLADIGKKWMLFLLCPVILRAKGFILPFLTSSIPPTKLFSYMP